MSESNRNNNESQKFELISKESIKLIAEQNGFQNVNEEAILLLSSDVSFRLREIIHNSIQFMRHSNRRQLTCDDISRSLEWSDCELVFGYNNNKKPINDVLVKEAKVFVSDDPIVDLVEESNKILNEDICDIDLYEKSTNIDINFNISLSVETHLETNAKNSFTNDCPQELIDYYQNVVKAILGNNNRLLMIALKDLSVNSGIRPILPFLINFIYNGIKKLSHDICQLKRFLNTIECLFKNESLFLESEPFMRVLIESVVHCILEPLNPISDHWTLRDSASHLLANILRQRFTPFHGNELMIKTINSLIVSLLDFTKPFSSHYGAIKAFIAFGYNIIIDHLYPRLYQYLAHLLSSLNQSQYLSDSQTRTDALKVFGELLLVAEIILLELRSLVFQDLNVDKYNRVYGELSDIFGDSLYARLPSDFENIRHVFYSEKKKNSPKSDINLFSTSESLQTGEELLDAFYEVPEHMDDINSNISANLEDDNSCDETSVISDNEKETVPTDVDLQIKSTISDPTLGIKLTIKKLRRDQNESEIPNKRMKSNKKPLVEPVFESVPLIQNRIKFNINGVTKQFIMYKKVQKIDFQPTQWFMINKRRNFIQKKILINSINKFKHNLYSCDLLNVL